MKKLIIVLVSVAHFMACNTDASKQQGAETKASPTVETKSEVKTDTTHVHVFACPMDPEITGKEGEKCSKCGMALVHKD
jgi:hypothetical protein